MANENGRWVTLDNGTHLFIEKGQTVDDAISKLKPSKQENGVKYETGYKRPIGVKDEYDLLSRVEKEIPLQEIADAYNNYVIGADVKVKGNKLVGYFDPEGEKETWDYGLSQFNYQESKKEGLFGEEEKNSFDDSPDWEENNQPLSQDKLNSASAYIAEIVKGGGNGDEALEEVVNSYPEEMRDDVRNQLNSNLDNWLEENDPEDFDTEKWRPLRSYQKDTLKQFLGVDVDKTNDAEIKSRFDNAYKKQIELAKSKLTGKELENQINEENEAFELMGSWLKLDLSNFKPQSIEEKKNKVFGK